MKALLKQDLATVCGGDALVCFYRKNGDVRYDYPLDDRSCFDLCSQMSYDSYALATLEKFTKKSYHDLDSSLELSWKECARQSK